MRALLIEQDALQARIASAFLREGGFSVDALPQAPHDLTGFDLVVIEHAMAADFLAANQRRPVTERLPVILLVDDAEQSDLIEGLVAGHYTASRPVTKAMLLALADRAVRSRARIRDVAEELERDRAGLQLLVEAEFSFRTRGEACALAGTLSHAFPNPGAASVGMLELLVNAVEHGNLEIGGQEKQRLIEVGLLDEEIERRLAGPLGRRRAKVRLRREAERLELIVEDEGPGFDPRSTQPDARAFHGRGLAMARAMSFDLLDFEPPGNRAIAVVFTAPKATLDPRGSAQAPLA